MEKIDAKGLQKIIAHMIRSGELQDMYDLPDGTMDNYQVTFYVKDITKQPWRSSNINFSKAFEKEVEIVIDQNYIGFENLGFLLYLSCAFTSYEDNALRNKDGEFITQRELIDTMSKTKIQASESKYKRMLKELEDKKLIFTKPHPLNKSAKVYYISPYLFYKGKYISQEFRDDLTQFCIKIREELNKNDEYKNVKISDEELFVTLLNIFDGE